MSDVSYNRTQELKFWCQKTLPLVYDDSLSYYELLAKVVKYLNDTTEDVRNLIDEVEDIVVDLQNVAIIDDSTVASDYVWSSSKVNAVANTKVDKVAGKGLSANDYTNADKNIVSGVTSALAGKVDKVTGKGLSTNDFTDADKDIVDGVTSALADKVDTSSVGVANGVASLNSSGKVPYSQIDVMDEILDNYRLPVTSNAIYDAISGINEKIPDVASTENQLITESQVNLVLGFKADLSGGKVPLAQLPVETTVEDGSDYPVSSNAVYDALATKANTDAIDSIEYTLGRKADLVNGKVPIGQMSVESSVSSGNVYPVTSGGVYSGIQDVYEVNGVVGAKNLNGTKYQNYTNRNGIDWVVNSDGSVTANGTSSGSSLNGNVLSLSFVAGFTAQVILSGCTSSDSKVHMFPIDMVNDARPYTDSSKTTLQTNNCYGGNEVSFYMEKGHTYAMIIRINGENVTVTNEVFYPMLRLASDTDDTYAPYAETNYQLTQNKVDWKSNGVLGAKNLLPYPYPNNPSLPSGLFSADGAFIIADGTASGGDKALQLSGRNDDSATIKLKKGNYILSGNSNTDGSTYIQAFTTKNGSFFELALTNSATEIGFSVTDDILVSGKDYATIGIIIGVKNNKTVDNAIFKPMIRLATDTDSTYVPYAMTNRQLTTDKANASALGTVENGTTASKSYAVGEHFYKDGHFCTVTQAIASGGTLTEGTNYSVGDIASTLSEKVKSYNVSANSEKKVNLVNGHTYMLVMTHPLNNTKGLYFASVYNNTMNIVSISADTALTLTNTGLELTVATTAYIWFKVIDLGYYS